METYTLEHFLADTRDIIKSKGISSGLEEIRLHLERLLQNLTLLKDHMGDPVPYTNLTTIGHDPETDVHVLVHGREKAGQSAPHDHGPCCVIYGNYTNYTRMKRWKRLDNGGSEGHAALKLEKDFILKAGQAEAFGVGDIHSIEYPDNTFFIRVTVGDVEQQKTLRFNLENQTVEIEDRSKGRK